LKATGFQGYKPFALGIAHANGQNRGAQGLTPRQTFGSISSFMAVSSFIAKQKDAA